MKRFTIGYHNTLEDCEDGELCWFQAYDAERTRADRAEANTRMLEDFIDLMTDEFKRISAIGDSEIRGICARAVTNAHQHTPVIVQRDRAEARVKELEARIADLEKPKTCDGCEYEENSFSYLDPCYDCCRHCHQNYTQRRKGDK